ncbi:MAG: GntR family transcriptional regulator [Thermoguttaceae bacterium]
MNITLDYHSPEPLTQQVVLQIKRLIITQRLKSGDRLPSVRQLAKELKINPTTCSRIFAQLAKEGVVIQKPGLGVFVADGPSPFSTLYISETLKRIAITYLVEGFRFGLQYEELQTVLEEEHEKIKSETNL